MDVYLVNSSTLLSASSLDLIVPALQEQVSRDFAPLWGVDATLKLADEQPAGEPTILLLDSCGNPNDLGFHLDDAGTPVAKVGIGDALQYGVIPSTVISHELLELLADPTTRRMVSQFSVEVCDPVSADHYSIGNIAVSNFCTPRYFGYTNMGHYDQMGLLPHGVPEVRPGGMVMFWSGTYWTTTMGRTLEGHLPWRVHYSGRSAYRAATLPS